MWNIRCSYICAVKYFSFSISTRKNSTLCNIFCPGRDCPTHPRRLVRVRGGGAVIWFEGNALAKTIYLGFLKVFEWSLALIASRYGRANFFAVPSPSIWGDGLDLWTCQEHFLNSIWSHLSNVKHDLWCFARLESNRASRNATFADDFLQTRDNTIATNASDTKRAKFGLVTLIKRNKSAAYCSLYPRTRLWKRTHRDIPGRRPRISGIAAKSRRRPFDEERRACASAAWAVFVPSTSPSTTSKARISI